MPTVLAIAAHPDDIEFGMAGTLIRLAEVGWTLHYFNIANGCCGSKELSRAECAAVRLREALAASELLGANFHPPIRNDLEVFYDVPTHREVAAVVRSTKPSIILTHALVDYMEDHQNAARLAVGGAFVRAMPNFAAVPDTAVYDEDVAVYHAQPHGNIGPLGGAVTPTHYVDVGDLMPRKRQLLAQHASQEAWLDETQRISAYLELMAELNREVGQMSGAYEYAEGWQRHGHLGLSAAGYDPLSEALSPSGKLRIAGGNN